jgi:hypothetical protein
MSLSDLAAIGSLVSGIAVVISLVYLSFQIRQTTKNQRGTMHQMRASLSTDVMLRIAESGLAHSFRAGLTAAPEISEAEFWQFFYAASAILRTTENAFTQHRDGLISDAHFASAKASARTFLMNPGYRALWQVTRVNREPGFREFMDELAADPEGPSSPDLFSAWKSHLQPGAPSQPT